MLTSLFLLFTLSTNSVLPTEPPNEDLMVGKWKISRKIPLNGPNLCYVDALTFFENNEFELVFKTLIANEERVYTYTGNVTSNGDANIALGDGVAYLKNFNQVDNTVDFRFEYGENLGMFCTREKHPYPHKHEAHDVVGKKINS